MSRFAKERRVFFLEEPIYEDGAPHLRSTICGKSGVHVLTPVIPPDLSADQAAAQQEDLLVDAIYEQHISKYLAWYYTPMAIEFTSRLKPALTIYDCMDELSGFAGAPPRMTANEKHLFAKADLVFTGGASLYAAKRKQHDAVFLFPSSVDVEHFARARSTKKEPADQAHLPQPRLGYAGVIDERMDLDLIRAAAECRRDWQFVFIGPVVKIDPASLPQADNIHYLGMKAYADLPAYFSGWRIGMLPFALNAATRYISPTKTPEYLAAGLRVVSMPIHDVVSPYGEQGLAAIAGTPMEFVAAVDTLLRAEDQAAFQARVSHFLALSSWDKTWAGMSQSIDEQLAMKTCRTPPLVEALRKEAAHV